MPRPHRSPRRARRHDRARPQPHHLPADQPGYLAPDVPLRSPLPRLAWRYRSELAPLYAAVALLAAGVVLHLWLSGWWPIIAATGTAAAAIVGLLGYRLGLDRQAERAYAITTTTAATAWLAAATWWGPIRRPLLLTWLAGTLAGGVPWWWHRRRRAKVRVLRAVERWGDDAAAANLDGTRLQRVEVDPSGRQWSARILLPKGQTLKDVLDRVPKLESALGLRPRAIRVEEDPTLARRVILRVVERDPHAGVLPMPDLVGPLTITRPVLVAEYETGEPLRVDLLRKHTLIGAASGAGKTTLVTAILYTLGPAPDVLVWAVDFAGGAGLAPWRPCLGRLATTPTEAQALLEDACAAVDARERWLADHGQENWQPTPATPAIVLPVDELAELVEQLPDAATLLDTIARKGRKTAITLLVSTQRPTQEALGGGALRAQLTVRVCLRVTEPADGELILGRGKSRLGYRPDLLDAPGKLLVWDPPDHTRPIPAKVLHVDRARIPRLLATAGPAAVPDLDPATAAALAEPARRNDAAAPAAGPGRAAQHSRSRPGQWPRPRPFWPRPRVTVTRWPGCWRAYAPPGPAAPRWPSWPPRSAGPRPGSTNACKTSTARARSSGPATAAGGSPTPTTSLATRATTTTVATMGEGPGSRARARVTPARWTPRAPLWTSGRTTTPGGRRPRAPAGRGAAWAR
jgi:S-DNA-T family DNA segregation ATPase FtsK/SpoIIIE